MKLTSKHLNIIKWMARILALILLVFGLMFYFGYGNPLPFIDPEYTWLENAWLTLIPFVFIGLAVGWKYEIFGGYLIVISLILGAIFAWAAGERPPSLFTVMLIPAFLYLWSGYARRKKTVL